MAKKRLECRRQDANDVYHLAQKANTVLSKLESRISEWNLDTSKASIDIALMQERVIGALEATHRIKQQAEYLSVFPKEIV